MAKSDPDAGAQTSDCNTAELSLHLGVASCTAIVTHPADTFENESGAGHVMVGAAAAPPSGVHIARRHDMPQPMPICQCDVALWYVSSYPGAHCVHVVPSVPLCAKQLLAASTAVSGGSGADV